MARDQRILEIFEITDDSLQGLLGYYLYVISAVGWAPDNGIVSSLPQGRIPLTHEWDRNYDPRELVTTMRGLFVAYQTRISLVAMVNIFEAATRSFVDRLEETNHPQNIQGDVKHYKTRLKWAFTKVAGSTFGNQAMQARILQLCLEVDHARRLRNISVHNNGLFNDRYKDDAISVCNHPGLTHPDFQHFLNNKTQPLTMILYPDDYIQLSKSHVELLHFLHHEIQSQDFGETAPYDYRKQGKRIEWHRVFFGY